MSDGHDEDEDDGYWRLVAYASMAAKRRIFYLTRKKDHYSLCIAALRERDGWAPPGKADWQFAKFRSYDVIQEYIKDLQDPGNARDYADILAEHGVEVWPSFPVFDIRALRGAQVVEFDPVRDRTGKVVRVSQYRIK